MTVPSIPTNPHDPSLCPGAHPAGLDFDQLERWLSQLSSRDGEIATILDSIRRILRADNHSDLRKEPHESIVTLPGQPTSAAALSSAPRMAAAYDSDPTSSPFLGMTLAELECRAIVAALTSNAGNKAKTARALGISLRSIYNKMRRHGLILSKSLSQEGLDPFDPGIRPLQNS